MGRSDTGGGGRGWRGGRVWACMEGEREGGITPETTENINQVNFTRGCTLGFRVWRESTNMGRVLSSLLVVLSSSSYRFQPSVKCSIPRRIFRRAAPLGRRGIKLRLGGSRCGSTRYRTEGMELKSGWGRSWVFLLFLFSYFFYLSILRVNVMEGSLGWDEGIFLRDDRSVKVRRWERFIVGMIIGSIEKYMYF